MTDTPNIGKLLAPHMANVPPESVPAFLCALERIAAGRYRDWSQHCEPAQRDRLLACAAREDEIADRVLELLPARAEDQAAIEAALPAAGDVYRSLLAALSLHDQWRFQADAERQGAAAWRGIAGGQDDEKLATALEAVARLEEQSADELTAILAEL